MKFRFGYLGFYIKNKTDASFFIGICLFLQRNEVLFAIDFEHGNRHNSVCVKPKLFLTKSSYFIRKQWPSTSEFVAAEHHVTIVG